MARVIATESTKDNLCNYCQLDFPTCPKANHIKFGDGKGNDNVIECSEFVCRSFRKVATEISALLPSPKTYYPYDAEMFQELFDYMSENHNVTLLESEMDEIMRICLKVAGGKVVASSRGQENDTNEDKDYQKSKANILIKAGYIAGKNDVNVELLEALKSAVKFIQCCPALSNEDRSPKGLERWGELVTNYEKQMKQ